MPESVNYRLLERSIEDGLLLARYTASEREKINALLLSIAVSLRKELAGLTYDDAVSVAKRRAAIKKYITDGQKIIDSAFTDYGAEFTERLKELAEYEVLAAVMMINKVLEAQILPEIGLSAKGAADIVKDSWLTGRTISEMLAGLDEAIKARFAQEMRAGFMAGETVQQLALRLTGYTDENGVKHEGIMNNATKKKAEAIAITAVNGISNEARMQLFTDNDDIIDAIMWIATLDTRTCLSCASFDRCTWDIKTKKPYENKTDKNLKGHDLPFTQPPLHLRCRCVLTPVILDALDDIEGIPPRTRASMDGQVPAATTFEQWFEKQSKERQLEILGKGRYELYKAGKITFSDLVDQNGRALTLKELKAAKGIS